MWDLEDPSLPNLRGALGCRCRRPVQVNVWTLRCQEEKGRRGATEEEEEVEKPHVTRLLQRRVQ